MTYHDLELAALGQLDDAEKLRAFANHVRHVAEVSTTKVVNGGAYKFSVRRQWALDAAENSLRIAAEIIDEESKKEL